ncbi:MAG: SCP-like extracellular [Conexibacter sp.]|nr:SCP-like extracellular [Conexibacter sp.]
MRIRSSLLFLLALLAALLVPASAGARAGACDAGRVAVTRATVAQARDATLCLLNRERTRRGLRPLTMNERLTRVAAAHSRDMVIERYFAHDSLDGTTPFQRIIAAHYVPPKAGWSLAENIGWGADDLAQPLALVRAWMHSAPHRANILSRDFREIGVGIAAGVPVRSDGTGGTYTTDFGRHT